MLQHVMGVCFELPGLVAWWSRSAPSVNMAAIWQLQPNLLALIFLPYLQEGLMIIFNVVITTLKIIIRQFGSNQTTSDARGKIGIERGSGPAGKVTCPNCINSQV